MLLAVFIAFIHGRLKCLFRLFTSTELRRASSLAAAAEEGFTSTFPLSTPSSTQCSPRRPISFFQTASRMASRSGETPPRNFQEETTSLAWVQFTFLFSRNILLGAQRHHYIDQVLAALHPQQGGGGGRSELGRDLAVACGLEDIQHELGIEADLEFLAFIIYLQLVLEIHALRGRVDHKRVLLEGVFNRAGALIAADRGPLGNGHQLFGVDQDLYLVALRDDLLEGGKVPLHQAGDEHSLADPETDLVGGQAHGHFLRFLALQPGKVGGQLAEYLGGA